MTEYTDAEVDAIALAILNDDARTGRMRLGNKARVPFDTFAEADRELPNLGEVYRSNARAALAARDALFETVGERWEVRDGEGYSYPHETRDAAVEERDDLLAHGFENASLVRITTKRRKR